MSEQNHECASASLSLLEVGKEKSKFKCSGCGRITEVATPDWFYRAFGPKSMDTMFDRISDALKVDTNYYEYKKPGFPFEGLGYSVNLIGDHISKITSIVWGKVGCAEVSFRLGKIEEELKWIRNVLKA